MDLIKKLAEIVGDANVLQGNDAANFAEDWTKRYPSQPLAVLRPGSTDEVSQIMKLAHDTGTPVVPVSGNTSLAGGTYAEGALMISLSRMNRIRDIRPTARIAIVEAGVILSSLHEACAVHDLIFPLTFGARGSAMIGGALSSFRMPGNRPVATWDPGACWNRRNSWITCRRISNRAACRACMSC